MLNQQGDRGMKMSRTARTRIILLATIILIMNVNITTNDSSGEVTADFDLDVDRTVVHLYEESGNMGSFTVEVTNRCIHVLTIQVRCDTPGITVSPQVSIVTVNSGASVDIGIVLARSLGSPAQITPALVNARITRVNGVAVDDGKERNAKIIVLTHRTQELAAEAEDVNAGKGETTSSSIVIHNMGNSEDYFSLEFMGSNGVQGYPAVDHIQVPYGESMEYPIYITVPEKTSKGDYSLDYSVRSLVDENVSVTGFIRVIVGDGGSSSNEAGSFDGWFYFSLSIFSLVSFLFLAHLLRGIRDVHGNTNIPRSITILLCSMLVLMSCVPLASMDSEAQFTPDFTVTVTNPSIQLDPSPLTSDEMVIGGTDVQLTSNSANELVVRVEVDVPHVSTGFVKEHRLVQGAIESFHVSFARSKR